MDHLRWVRVSAIAFISWVHTDASKKHLADSIRNTRYTGCLTKQIAPSLDPWKYSDLFLWHNMLGDKVHATGGWISRYQLSDRTTDTHCHTRTYKPAPNRGRWASGSEGIWKGSWNRSQHSKDWNGIRNSRPSWKLSSKFLKFQQNQYECED